MSKNAEKSDKPESRKEFIKRLEKVGGLSNLNTKIDEPIIQIRKAEATQPTTIVTSSHLLNGESEAKKNFDSLEFKTPAQSILKPIAKSTSEQKSITPRLG